MKWTAGIVAVVAGVGALFGASAGASSKPRSGCRVAALAPQHVPPNGITATASLQCSTGHRHAVLVVDLVVPGPNGRKQVDSLPRRGIWGVVARRRAPLPAVRADGAYHATAKTDTCVTYGYATIAKLLIGGRNAGAWLSRQTFIDCNQPADNRCQVVAGTPTMSGGNLLGPGSITCVSDQPLAVYKVTLEELGGGAWQDDGTIQNAKGLKGGQTTTTTVQASCANEGGPPWPRDFRTVVELQRAGGPVIDRTSATAPLSCPENTYPLSVRLTGGGSGTVTSTPAGIDCPQTCAYGFTYGSSVTLTAQPSAGSMFQGWVGGSGPPPGPCSGTGPCTVTINNTYGPPSVIADFEIAPPVTKSAPAWSPGHPAWPPNERVHLTVRQHGT